MKEIPVQSWGEFEQNIKEIESYRDQVQQSRGTRAPELLFRGQANSSWRLETTLERQIRSDRHLPPQSSADYSAFDYLHLIYCLKPQIETRTGAKWDTPEFHALAQKLRDDLDRLPPPMYEFMAYLRHHNFPSPFLDWTASPYVAAYFAFKGIAPGVKEVAIYAYLEFDEEIQARKVDAARIGSVGPTIKAHVRHFSQQAQYTYCRKKQNSDDDHWDWVYTSHEDAFGPRGEHKSDHLWKITILASERKSVLKYLDQHNLTGFSLFHSDESLMETLALREFTLRQ